MKNILNTDIAFLTPISLEDKLMFTKHLSTMLQSGVPIHEALQTLAEQTENKRFGKVLFNVLGDLSNGQTLAQAMGDHPDVFDAFFINLVYIGEESGTLEQNLKFLAEQVEKDTKLKKKVQASLLYPSFVLITFLVIGAFVSIFVLPQLLDFFTSLEAELPPATQMLLWTATLMQDYGVLIFGSIFGAIIAGALLIQTTIIRPYWDTFILRIPFIGKLSTYTEIARLTRNLGTLLKSGVPITKSLETVANTMGNTTYTRIIRKVSKQHQQGKSLGDAFSEIDRKFLPPIVVKMIQVGEKTAHLEDNLLYIGDFYDNEIDTVAKSLTTILEPVLLVVIGLGVAIFAMAIIGPIYDITGQVAR